MLCDLGNGRCGLLPRPQALVMEVQCGAVVDQPEPLVPDEQVRVPRRAVDVRHERVEPDDVGSLLGRRTPGLPANSRARPEGSRRRGSSRRLPRSDPGSPGRARLPRVPDRSRRSRAPGRGSPAPSRALRRSPRRRARARPGRRHGTSSRRARRRRPRADRAAIPPRAAASRTASRPPLSDPVAVVIDGDATGAQAGLVSECPTRLAVRRPWLTPVRRDQAAGKLCPRSAARVLKPATAAV